MPRSKSPAPRKSSSASNEAHINFGIALAIFVGCVAWSNNFDVKSANPQEGKWVAFVAGEGDHKIHSQWPYGVLITLHALNTAQSAPGGFWLSSAVANYFNTFASTIVAALFFGAGTFADIYNAENAALAGACWFLVNNSIGGFNAWDKVKEVGGSALNQVLDLATLAFTLNAAFAGNITDAKITNWQSIIAIVYVGFKAAVVANAGNFFPLDKGFDFNGFDSVSDAAFTTVCFVALANTAGIGDTLNTASALVGAPKALSASFLSFANVMVAFFTGSGVCPAFDNFNIVAQLQDKLYELTGFSR